MAGIIQGNSESTKKANWTGQPEQIRAADDSKRSAVPGIIAAKNGGEKTKMASGFGEEVQICEPMHGPAPYGRRVFENDD